jgi:glucosamine--fructose-6-phosphate aminotransferase (isomerizing)
MREVLAKLGERRADVVAIGPSDAPGAADERWPGAAPTSYATLRIATPDVDERYAPLLDILPLQRLALALALARGEDPDAPRGLNKVTVTR